MTGFSHDEILECARLAQAAYGAVRPSGAVALEDKPTDCQGFVTHDSERKLTFVVFRGTSSVQDALIDCRVRLVPLAPGSRGPRVHAGFLAQVQAVWPAVRRAVGEFGPSGVRVTGHSLAAADGMITALKLATELKLPTSFVGFGTPRVGDAAWKAAFEAAVPAALRVKDGCDPVAGVPEAPYVHAGPEAHVGRPDPHPELPLMTNIPDHDISLYVSNCTADDPSAKGTSFAAYLLAFVQGHTRTADAPPVRLLTPAK